MIPGFQGPFSPPPTPPGDFWGDFHPFHPPKFPGFHPKTHPLPPPAPRVPNSPFPPLFFWEFRGSFGAFSSVFLVLEGRFFPALIFVPFSPIFITPPTPPKDAPSPSPTPTRPYPSPTPSGRHRMGQNPRIWGFPPAPPPLAQNGAKPPNFGVFPWLPPPGLGLGFGGEGLRLGFLRGKKSPFCPQNAAGGGGRGRGRGCGAVGTPPRNPPNPPNPKFRPLPGSRGLNVPVFLKNTKINGL